MPNDFIALFDIRRKCQLETTLVQARRANFLVVCSRGARTRSPPHLSPLIEIQFEQSYATIRELSRFPSVRKAFVQPFVFCVAKEREIFFIYFFWLSARRSSFFCFLSFLCSTHLHPSLLSSSSASPLFLSSHSFKMEQYVAGLEQTLQQVLFSNDSNQIKEVNRDSMSGVPETCFLTAQAILNTLHAYIFYNQGKLTHSLSPYLLLPLSLQLSTGYQDSQQPVLCRG